KGKTLPKNSKSGKSIIAEEPDEEHVHDMSLDVEENINYEMANADEQPDGEATLNTNDASKNNWFKQPPKPPTPYPEWTKCQVVDDQPEQTSFNDLTNPEGDRCSFHLSKPLPLKGHPGHLTILVEYFFNNDLEYLKSKNMERKYTMLITKTKSMRYELVRIKDMISKQWSTIKVGYNKDAAFGLSH
nr:hypothetical protein [Tanacetum cinerariifolium]